MTNNWPIVLLGEFLTERQETPDSDDLITGEIPIISKIGFDTGRIELRDDGKTRTKMILIRPGDLVLSGINAAKGAIAIYGKKNTHPIAATIHYSSYSVDETKANIKFLWWLLRSGAFRDLLFRYVPGGIKTELKAKRFLPIPVPLPPLGEQRRIVARIEELAAKVEQAQSLRQKSEVETEAVLSTAMKKVLGETSVNGHLSDVLLEKPRNGWSPRCDNAEDGTPVLTLSAVTGFVYKENEFKRTSFPTSPDAHYWLQEGDLLITRSNTPELVGHAAIYDGSPKPCIYPDLMMKMVVDESLADTQFVHWWLRSIAARDFIARSAKGTSPTMKKISQKVVMNIPFPSHLSPLEQHRIVAYLDNLQAKVEAVKRHQVATAAKLDALLPSILDKAFRGEL
jgi:type I restriction enzyme S subunit